ncbi:MAG: T9SS type A sorting domain-containing protein [bacterium]|nr:T9SS type A sorting domain-containing protein [bacterium]
MKKIRFLLILMILSFGLISVYSDLTALLGWPVTLSRNAGQVLVSDIDKDGDNEVIVGDGDYVYIFTSTGVQQAYTWNAGGMLQSLGDIDNDGYDEIAAPYSSRMVVLDYNLIISTGWPQGVPGAPVEAVLADLDGDGNREVIYGETSYWMYVKNGDGSDYPGWPYRTDEGTFSVSVVGRLINELKEKKITSNMSGYFYTWNYTGSVLKYWEPLLNNSKRNVIAALSPIYADIDNDGEYEIICALDKLYAWNSDGTLVKGFPYAVGSPNSVSIGDADGDGHLEIVYGDTSGWVHCVSGDGKLLKGWPVKVSGEYPDIDTSAVIGDLDGDNENEILISEGLYAVLYAWNSDGTVVENFNASNYRGGTTACLCDLNKDGNLDILYGTGYDVFALTTNTSYNPENIEWPMFHHDKFRTGNYNSPLLKSPSYKSSISDTLPELIIWNAENFNYDVYTYTYSFYIYSDPEFNTIIDSATGVIEGSETTSWTVTVPLQDDTRYYWRARPHNGTHYEHWMPIGEFFVNKSNQVPGPFHLISPPDNSSVSVRKPRLKWTESVDPDGDDFLTYRIEYSIYPDFRSYESAESLEPDRYKFPDFLSDGEIYYWRVRVTDSSGGERLSSETFRFFIETDLLSRIKIYPNPVKPGNDLTFENISNGITVKIYNISGDLVQSLSEEDGDGILVWDLRNKAGVKVSSGIYLIEVKSENSTRLEKIAVIK